MEFGLHVAGNVKKASVVDAEIRAAQSERNAKREPFCDELQLRRKDILVSVFRLLLLFCTLHVATRSDMVLDHDANRLKLLLELKLIRFGFFFQF